MRRKLVSVNMTERHTVDCCMVVGVYEQNTGVISLQLFPIYLPSFSPKPL